MLTKKQRLQKEKNKNQRLLKMIADERSKVAGYVEIAKVHSAYIAILLKKLGATTADNAITFTASDVSEALLKMESRAMQTEGGFSLFCEEVEIE